jgi:hypothetical protein
MRKLYSILSSNSTKNTDHIKHGFSDCTTINTRVCVRDSTGDFQAGMQDASHAKHDAWIIFIDPGGIRQKNSVNMTNQILIISYHAPSKKRSAYLVPSHSRCKSFTSRLLLSFNQHHQIHIQFSSLSKSSSSTSNSKYRSFVITDSTSVEVSIPS